MWKSRYKSKEREEYACVNCQEVSTTIYRKYSEGVIRLTECEKCGEVVDKYIEQDVVLVVIDLMLQYVQAYRHLLLNVKIQRPERLFVIFWLSHAAEVWIRDKSSSETQQVADQEWMFYRCLLLSAAEICSYLCVILLYSLWKNEKNGTNFKHLIGSTLLGYYGNVAVVISFIFCLSHRLSYQIVMQIFLLVSHVQVQRVLFPTVSMTDNIIVVLVSKMCSTITGGLLTSAVL
ncbi:hypothetical protein GCK72_004284 [Caenorhabditis remanei]|uniref:Protein ARV n=1 Tax=Caenorhabditis remanei TaxID=31234 RepID=A0A6A5HB12_CAERE|nr:hypothetical protein GCK72_004284 [Caenorhabditis remanei]KAF1764337.1 hypothetical protein GCK72_004284 [Caenorhabditis remanei]